MKQKQLTIFIPLLLLVLSFPGSLLAQAFFPAMGQIESITHNSMRLSDNNYKLSPTVKVILSNNKKAVLSEVKAGDLVGVTFITINKQQLIDTIQMLKP